MDEERSPIVIVDDAMRGGFTQIPNAVLRNPNITTGAKVAYGVLLSYAWQDDHCFPGQERMARDMGVTERSVITYLKQLDESGLIDIKRRGLGKTNLYTINRIRDEDFSSQEVKSLHIQR